MGNMTQSLHNIIVPNFENNVITYSKVEVGHHYISFMYPKKDKIMN
jgi:hypothetical protein